MAPKSQRDAEAEVRSWGFSHVFTWTDRPFVFSSILSTDSPSLPPSYLTPIRNAHYPPHTHTGLTTHLILRGSLTVTYPDDVSPAKETFGPGGRLDVAAGRNHEVWMGVKDGIQVLREMGVGLIEERVEDPGVLGEKKGKEGMV
ncbi:hypothetical protein LTR60_005945 [Cryomyces antarcticus]|nr:hypothetical protein LTR60_005945 [Cryomyces antarcticus]KAK5017336.1 hypothetical protein LTR39_001601 [Cryomyces antarcticus]